MRQGPLLLLLSLSGLAFSAVTTSQIMFAAVKLHSISAPAAMESAPGLGRLECAELCSVRPACFGFSWLQGLCRLFDWLAFSSPDGWQVSESCDVYTRIVDPQPHNRLKLESCSQSSTYGSSACERAIDGNRNQDYFANSVRQHQKKSVRMDCCPERLEKFSLQVDGVECNRVNLTVPFSVANFSCNAFGSRVRVTNLLNEFLGICEIEAYRLQSRNEASGFSSLEKRNIVSIINKGIASPKMKLILPVLLCSALEFSLAMSVQLQFKVVKLRSNSTPVAMATLPGRDSMNCATLGALRPASFGFSWLQGLCRLFDWLAFSSTDGWQASESCDVYARIDCCAERLNKFSLQVDGVECNRVSRTKSFSVANFSCNAFGSRVRF
uniref:Apple domain-containing protein n=1 Tax=Macrostomum lignano TaxID=282301 RepID=A0A1I8GNT1_9PLAT